jgi:CheY-like chemotaxis protein
MFTSDQIWKAVDVLAREHGLSASRLSIMAGLDPTALNKSKRIGSEGRPRWMSTETVAKILSVTNTSLGDFVRIIDQIGPESAGSAVLHANAGWIASRPHVLIVDQDEGFAAQAAASLGEAGYETRIVPDFRHALELIESGGPLDMLIVNTCLPYGVRGSALGRIARLRRPEVKILLLSAGDGSEADWPEVGHVLRKPCEDARLVSEAARLLQS